MRRSPVVLLGLVALVSVACQAPPPVAEEKPKRKSFAESSQRQPSAAPAAAGSDAPTSIDSQAQQVNDKWEQVRNTSDEAERQRLANEALQETRAMADQPSGQ